MYKHSATTYHVVHTKTRSPAPPDARVTLSAYHFLVMYVMTYCIMLGYCVIVLCYVIVGCAISCYLMLFYVTFFFCSAPYTTPTSIVHLLCCTCCHVMLCSFALRCGYIMICPPQRHLHRKYVIFFGWCCIWASPLGTRVTTAFYTSTQCPLAMCIGYASHVVMFYSLVLRCCGVVTCPPQGHLQHVLCLLVLASIWSTRTAFHNYTTTCSVLALSTPVSKSNAWAVGSILHFAWALVEQHPGEHATIAWPRCNVHARQYIVAGPVCVVGAVFYVYVIAMHMRVHVDSSMPRWLQSLLMSA